MPKPKTLIDVFGLDIPEAGLCDLCGNYDDLILTDDDGLICSSCLDYIKEEENSNG